MITDIREITILMLETAEPVQVWRYRERQLVYREDRVSYRGILDGMNCPREKDRENQAIFNRLHRRFAGSKADNHQVCEVKLVGGEHVHVRFSDWSIHVAWESKADPLEYAWERR
jgi:hypothetical protein